MTGGGVFSLLELEGWKMDAGIVVLLWYCVHCVRYSYSSYSKYRLGIVVVVRFPLQGAWINACLSTLNAGGIHRYCRCVLVVCLDARLVTKY